MIIIFLYHLVHLGGSHTLPGNMSGGDLPGIYDVDSLHFHWDPTAKGEFIQLLSLNDVLYFVIFTEFEFWFQHLGRILS